MKPRMGKPARIGIALALSAAIGAMTATIAQENPLTKPLNRFSIGDIFPRAVGESFAETGRSWKVSADDLKREAEVRKESVTMAAEVKKTELPLTKDELKEAKKQKDLAKIGALEGTLKSEELVLNILKKLMRLSEEQIEVAEAFRATGAAMERFTDADDAFDPFRGRQIARPEFGELDQRLGPDGYAAFRAHADAMKNLGEAFHDLGSRTQSLAKDRMDLLETLAKGGHVQAPN